MSHIFDEVSPYLPKYLTDTAQNALWAELRKFPGNMNYYLRSGFESALQGDVYNRKHFILTSTSGVASVRPTRVMIVSNSCDITAENGRDLPVAVLVAPVMRLEAYATLLTRSGAAESAIETKIAAIRRQEITSLFYLPENGDLEAESVVLLDGIQSVRRELLVLPTDRACTLSQAGFYLLLVKLSIHLCRAREGIDREAA